MSEHLITIEGGTTKRLLTAGKLCENDILVTATGGDGIDTSDATATELDLAEGKTAYVNGEKIEGQVEVKEGYAAWLADSAALTGNHLCVSKVFWDIMIRDGCKIELVTNEPIGDATAADVVAGKTFTSAEGINIVGTYEPPTGGGGLPSGISALECGSYTPESDVISRVYIKHTMGVRPDFAIIAIDGTVNQADFEGCSIAQFIIMQPFVRGETSFKGFMFNRICQASGFSVLTNEIGVNVWQYFDEENIGLYASSSYKLKGGATYRWIAGKFA